MHMSVNAFINTNKWTHVGYLMVYKPHTLNIRLLYNSNKCMKGNLSWTGSNWDHGWSSSDIQCRFLQFFS